MSNFTRRLSGLLAVTVLCALVLVGCGSSHKKTTVVSIAVTPTAPSIKVGATQQFTATGTNKDGTQTDVTSQVTWKSATTAVATISAAARSTICFGTGFIDVQCSSVKVGAIQSSDCPIAFRVVAHFNESKTSGLSGIPIGDDADAINSAMCCEHGSNRILGSTKAEVSHKNILHLFYSLSGVAEQ